MSTFFTHATYLFSVVYFLLSVALIIFTLFNYMFSTPARPRYLSVSNKTLLLYLLVPDTSNIIFNDDEVQYGMYMVYSIV